ncbi:very short patch repair endonuclease [Nocardia sp. bgisy118]|uniref:very short patch repair endonuclease n=1 Tax=Nocardia sp. bgisy118 TaxID=3413786 RepID=UPI003F49E386
MGIVPELSLPAGSRASSPEARAVMRANRRRDTTPELALRKLLYHRGLRYRVDASPIQKIRRKADIVFSADQVAVFVDGCFWHGCEVHHRPAVKNADFWRQKIAANQTRDRETNDALRSAGWMVIRVWEHEDPIAAADRIEQAIMRLRETRTPSGEARGRRTAREAPKPPRRTMISREGNPDLAIRGPAGGSSNHGSKR